MTEVAAREFTVPQLPVFDDPAEERTYLKQRLAAAFRLFALYGFDEGVAGHITARDPERPDHFWVNPFGMYFGHIRASDLILVNHEGDVVEGEGVGLCVDPQVPKQIAAAVNRMAADRKAREAMRANGLRLSMERYNWENEFRPLFERYRSLLADAPRRA